VKTSPASADDEAQFSCDYLLLELNITTKDKADRSMKQIFVSCKTA
jgi:hypothetical protein